MDIHLSYRLSRGDFYELNRVLTRRSVSNTLLRVFLSYFVLLTIFLGLMKAEGYAVTSSLWTLAYWLREPQESWWFYLLLASVTILALNAHRVTAMMLAARYRNYMGADDLVDVTINGDGIDVKSQYMTSHFKWTSFRKMIETRTHILLVTAPRQAFLIPRRAFTSPALDIEAIEVVRRYLPAGTPFETA